MRTFLAIALMFLSSGAWAATTTGAGLPQPLVNAFYVSSTGNDSTGTGTQALPFATLNKCQTAIQGGTAKKGCYIRAGTYTGSGVGYNTVTTANSSFSISEALHLTATDNGETWAEYPPDFPGNGVSSAIFDGGAGTWSSTSGAASGCTQNASPTTALGWGFYVDGASNITVNGLQFQNLCYGGLAANNGQQLHSQQCESTAAGTTSTGIVFKNNTIHNISNTTAQCGSDAPANTAPITITGTVQNSTVTHNLVYNSTGSGIRASGNYCCSWNTENFNGLTVDHNFVYNTLTAQCDGGALYFQDIAETTTNVNVQYNYVLDYGDYGNGYPTCSNANGGVFTSGGSSKAYYGDDGMSNITWTGNVATGFGWVCYNIHAGTNQVHQYNICDVQDASVTNPGSDTAHQGVLWQTSGNSPSGTDNWHQNIIVGNLTAACSDNDCAMLYDWASGGGVTTFGNDAFYNYGAAGTGALTTLANNQGDNGTTVNPAFSTCPGGNQNSWGFVIPSGSAVLSSPVSYPAQPSGWATPGFWGPAGYVIPHNITSAINGNTYTPSYGPTC